MYIRPSVVRRGGKTYHYFRLVRSVRRNGKVIQETVAQLGALDARGRREAQALAERIGGVRVEQQRSCFEAPESGEPQTVAVRLDRLRVERQRRFGDVWLGVTLWPACKGPGYKTAVSSPKLTGTSSAKLTAPGSAKLTT